MDYKEKRNYKTISFTFLLSLLVNIGMIVLSFVFYRYHYPTICLKKLGPSHIWILILPFLPTILALIGKISFSKLTENKKLTKIFFIALVLSILIGCIFTVFFIILPPISSSTKDSSRYMQLDGEFDKETPLLKDFYPEKIPANADEVTYFYERYSSLFSDEIEITASWTLPQDEYTALKNDTLNLSIFKDKNVSEDSGKGTVQNVSEVMDTKFVFEYNDDLNYVAYKTYTTKNY